MNQTAMLLKPFQRRRLALITAALLLASAFQCGCLKARGLSTIQAPGAVDQPQTPPASEASSTAPEDIIHLNVGRSQVLTSPVALRRIYIGNPSVLQSYTQGQKEVVITAKTAGISSLVLWDTEGGRKLYSVAAAIDLDGLQASIHDAFPGLAVKAESVDSKILLSGAVPTEAVSDSISKLSGVYSKDVVNSLQISPPRAKQVQLKLRIVEVDRTKMEQFGINFISTGKNSGGSNTGQFTPPLFNNPVGTGATVNDALNLSYFNIPLGLGLTIKDLEEKQILQVLAEPTLTTMSGLPARFLSGGEFPFPVVQGGTGNSTAITIMFRPYGVKVDFTPTVNPDGSIRLKVSPEVSTLDYSNSVTISGFTIPALSTRRAETEVEIRDGESFVVSGLLDHRTTDSLSRIPGIADIPILGQFFKSKSLNRSIVELVVIVTATVVDPLGQPQPTAEPKMVFPNMDSSDFDASATKALQTAPPSLKAVKP